MNKGFSFADLKNSKKGKTIEFEGGNTITTTPTKDPVRGVSKDIFHAPANWKEKHRILKKRTDLTITNLEKGLDIGKKAYEEIKKELESWVKSAGVRNKHMDEMAREIAKQKKDYKKLQAAFVLSNENNDELRRVAESFIAKEYELVKENGDLKEELDTLRQQETMSKQALDLMSKEVERFKFRPHQYSEIARLLICMRVRGNRSQKEQVLKIVGSTAIEDVREHIFKLLEAPYE